MPSKYPISSPESKSQVAATAVPVARDRNGHTILLPTHRTLHLPVTHSTAYRKDARALPPTPYARSRCLLASPRHFACSSPCAHSTNFPCGSLQFLFHVSRLAPRADSRCSSTASFRATAITARFFPFFPPRSASFSPHRRRSLSCPNGPKMCCAPCTSKVRK